METTAKLFKNGNSQAVRLPRAYRFEGEEVIIKKMGNAVVLLPQKAFYDALLESLAMFSEDFLIDREQPPVQDRDAWLE